MNLWSSVPRDSLTIIDRVVAALRLICDEWFWCAVATPGAIPKYLRNLRAELKTLILPPRPPRASVSRAVKIKMSNDARKQRKS